MANSSTLVKLTSVILVIMMVMGASNNFASAQISCGMVASKLGPCITYLRGTGGPVPSPCCSGVTALNGAARNTPARQAACKCLKSAATQIKGINFGLASSLPRQCGVNLPYKISPSIDCTKVQ